MTVHNDSIKTKLPLESSRKQEKRRTFSFGTVWTERWGLGAKACGAVALLMFRRWVEKSFKKTAASRGKSQV